MAAGTIRMNKGITKMAVVRNDMSGCPVAKKIVAAGEVIDWVIPTKARIARGRIASAHCNPRISKINVFEIAAIPTPIGIEIQPTYFTACRYCLLSDFKSC